MAYFREEERLITLSGDLHEKQTIENGLNRYVIHVRTISELVESIQEEAKRSNCVHILVTTSMGDIFKHHISEIVDALNAMSEAGRVRVVEIGVGELFHNALTFGDVTTFIAFCRDNERREYIQQLENTKDSKQQDESRILKELMIERDAAVEREAKTRVTVDELNEKLAVLQAEYQALETTVNHVYLAQIETAKKEMQRYEERQRETDRLYKLEKAKVTEYESESSQYRTQNKALEMDNASLKELNEDYKREVRGLQLQLDGLALDIKKLEKEKLEILKSRVDAEIHVQLSQQLEKSRGQVRKLEVTIQDMEVLTRKKDFEIAGYLQEIQELRQGVDKPSEGRVTLLDSIRLKSTNVYYVKLIHPLPYVASALRLLYNEIKKRDGGRTHICVLKHDDGLNDTMFKEYELYGTLGDVQAKHEKFMLYPTRRMFTNGDRFDAQVTSLLVLDFIQSRDYYITSESFQRVITVCTHSSMLHMYSLQGYPVSLDAGSTLEVLYDERIAKASTKEMQLRYIQMKVAAWARKLDITS